MINQSITKAGRIDTPLHLQFPIETSLFFFISLENNWTKNINSNKKIVSIFGNIIIYLKRK